MKKVAYLTSSSMVAASDGSREDAWEHRLQFELLRTACGARGIELSSVIWDDAGLDIAGHDAYVVGTTWDYHERPQAFLARLEAIAKARPLWNPIEVLRWNLDKVYLRELASRAAPIVPTRWADRADAASIHAAFEALGCDRLVVKPTIGGGAWRQVLLERGATVPSHDELPPAGAMMQPFMASVLDEGEYSFLFFDGVFSHCARKRPAKGDYRVQSIYGGREVVHEASAHEIAICERVLAAADRRLLYARVDMIRDQDDQLVLMELEVIEPYFYPEQGSRTGELFAGALERHLEG